MCVKCVTNMGEGRVWVCVRGREVHVRMSVARGVHGGEGKYAYGERG